MIELKKNGIVIQKNGHADYQGIEGENWYLNMLEEYKYFEVFYEENIERAWYDNQWIDCCTDINYIREYIAESKKCGVPYRIILCETTKERPVLENNDLWEVKILGYDYAYSGGDYYSCVYNELVGNRVVEFKDIELNENGLVSTKEELQKYILLRKEVERKYGEMFLEKGDFTIYRLSEIVNFENF